MAFPDSSSVLDKFQFAKLTTLVAQPLDPSPYSTIGCRYTISPFTFQVSRGIALYPPPISLYRS